MTAETVRLSVADAATRLGISTDTVRRKLKRGQLRGQRDNHGQWWIELSADAKAPEPMQRAAYEPRPDATAMLLEELRSQINRLSTDLDAAYAREIVERERHARQVLRLEERLTDMQAERDRWAGLAETSQQMAQLAAKLAEAEKLRGWWPWRRSV